MIRNVPCTYTRDLVQDMLDNAGFAGKYDFLYMPVDFKRGLGLGYAFVNMVGHEDALDAKDALEGFSDWAVSASKVCEVCWSRPIQGLEANVMRYRDGAVMRAEVPDEFKPILLSHGMRIPFPAAQRCTAMAGPQRTPDRDLNIAKEDANPKLTTVMIRNVPNNFTRSMLQDMLARVGFGTKYDFLYMPIDQQRCAGLGYAFVNMLTHDDALAVKESLLGFSDWGILSTKVCDVCWSRPAQGLDGNVERYRSCSAMAPSVPDEFKPIVLIKGIRVQYPPSGSASRGRRSGKQNRG